MKLFLQNTLTGLVPLYPSDLDEKKRLRLGETYEAEIRMPRNVGFHRKAFALFNIGWQNSDMTMPFDTYRKYVTMKAGYFKTYQTPKGTFYDATSLSFSSMDQETFEDVYNAVLDVIIEQLGCTAEDIDRMLGNFM
jgi:hypothetical protein